MSIKLMTAVFDLPLPPSQKIVLLALADIANDHGRDIWPSIETLGRKATLSPRQTQRVLRELAALQLLSVVGNEKGGKPGTTRNYIIHLDVVGRLRNTGDNLSPSDTTGVSPASQTGVVDDTQSILNHPVEKESNDSKKTDEDLRQFFESNFWPIFPKQRAGSRDKAFAAFVKAVEREKTTARIMRGLRAYAHSDEVKRGFAKGAAAWLNDDRWTVDYRAGQDSAPSRATPSAANPQAPKHVAMSPQRIAAIRGEVAMGCTDPRDFPEIFPEYADDEGEE